MQICRKLFCKNWKIKKNLNEIHRMNYFWLVLSDKNLPHAYTRIIGISILLTRVGYISIVCLMFHNGVLLSVKLSILAIKSNISGIILIFVKLAKHFATGK